MSHNPQASFTGAVLKQHDGMLQGTHDFQTLLTNLCYEGKPRRGGNIRRTRRILGFLNGKVIRQFRFEEKKLFPFVVRHIPKLEPAVHLLEAEHEEYKAQLKNFGKYFRNFMKKGDSRDLRETGTYLACLLRHHVRAEKRIFKALAGNLRPEEKIKFKQLLKKGSHENL
jgi:hemerythrin superfamily protein